MNGSVLEAVKRSTNQYSVLSSLPEDDPQEINMLSDRMIVDQYLNKHLQPTPSELKKWSPDMIKYFKEQEEEKE